MLDVKIGLGVCIVCLLVGVFGLYMYSQTHEIVHLHKGGFLVAASILGILTSLSILRRK